MVGVAAAKVALQRHLSAGMTCQRDQTDGVMRATDRLKAERTGKLQAAPVKITSKDWNRVKVGQFMTLISPLVLTHLQLGPLGRVATTISKD